MIQDFPRYWSAPGSILRYNSKCGPMAAWGVLKYFGIRVNAGRLPHACHSVRTGSYTISLAVVLREFGLNVIFHTDPDTDMDELEWQLYEKARQLGVPIRKAISLNKLLSRINEHCLAIVSYENSPEYPTDFSAHFSPLLGIEEGKLIMPYTDEKLMPRHKFLKGWRAPGIFKQCILISDKK